MNRLIFFSYSSKDENYARKLVKDIEKQGLQCWISCRDIMPGEDYQTAIVRALGQSAAMFLLFSKNANESAEIGKEMAIATARRIRVIPARMEDVTPTDAFEYQFATAQYIDLFRNYNEALNRLCDVLRQQVGLPVEERKSSSSLNKKPLLFGGVATLLAAGIGTTVFLYKPANMPAAVSTPVAAPAPVAALPPRNMEDVKQATVASAKTEEKTAPHPVAQPEAPPPPAPAPAEKVEAPTAAATPAPAAPSAPAPHQADNPDLEPLVEKIASVDPNNRISAIQRNLTDITGKFSYDQVMQLLHGLRNGNRLQALGTLVQFMQTPIPVPVALSLLQSTDNFRQNGIEMLDQYLPDSINGDEIIALLGGLEQSMRFQAVNKLSNHIQGGLTPDQALKILRGSDGFWSQTLERISSKLAKPVSADDLVRLLGETTQSNRFQSLKALSVAMPDTMSVAEVNKLLDGTESYRCQTIELLTHRLPRDLSPADITALLDGTENGNRNRALKFLAPHMQKNLQGTDVAPILEGMDGYWRDSVALLKPNLAKPQSQASLMALLGNTTQGIRAETLRVLHSLLPDQISATDAQALLQDTDGNYIPGLELLIPHMRRPNAEEIAKLVAPINSPYQSEQMAKRLREIH